MGGPSTRTVADRQTSIQIQTSAYGICIPVVYGTNRIGGNLVWFANFQATDHTTKTGGKGMGGSATNTTYTYSASAILALAEGTIDGIGAVWKDKDKTDLSTLGLSLFTGADAQAEWAFLSGYANLTNFNYDLIFGYQGAPAFVDQSLNYSGTAYLASPSYDLGDSATVPNHTFEVQGKLRFSGGADALPSAIIPDILTAQRYGVGFPAGNVDSLTSYQQYCQALGLFVSPAYTQARPGSDVIQELCDATNAAPVWSAGKLKIIPYGDAAATGNGATYTPNLTPQFDLSDDDFLEIEDGPIIVTRKTPADAYNRISVQFRNRANQYNQEVVTVEDQDAIEKYGLKVAPTMTCDFICDSAVAKQVAQLALQRQLYKRNEYEFELGARFPMLEPMDIVTLTDPGLGMDRVAVRLIEIEESDDGFRCIAEDLPIGVAAAATYTHDNGLRWQNTTAIPAGNCAAPVIFEMPPDQQATGLAVAIACGRQPADKMYGGCRVWLSLDGVNYKDQGVIVGSSRYGTTTAALPGVGAAGTDTTNTLSLSLRSGGQMLSGSAADMAKGTTLLNVGGEYLAYQNATLTGTNAYNLTTLNRGLYKTATGAKANGSTWVRVDDGILVMPDLDVTMIGQTVYIKVCSFNVYGAAEQSLASVSAYSYTITGNMKALESPADLAMGVVGQTAWATYTGFTPAQVTNPGANLIFNSSFNIGSLGWADGSWNGPVKAAGDVGAYYMATNGNNRYLYTADVTKTPVFPNMPYTFQVWAAANGTSSGGNRPYFYIDWHRADGSAISSSGLTFVPVGVGYQTLSVTGTAPADAAYARVVMNSNQVATGGGWVYTSKWKLELGGAMTPWSDDATNGALYQSGQTIDSLKPAQANADVTLSNTAAGIQYQGDLATQNKSSLPFGTGNRVRFSMFEKATTGWACRYNPSGLPISSFTAFDYNGVRVAKLMWTATAAGQTVSLGTSGASAYRIPVVAGETVAVAIAAEHLGPVGSINLAIGWMDASGTGLSSSGLPSTGTTIAGFATLYRTIVQVPAGAVSAYLEVYHTSSAAGLSSIAITQPMVMGVAAGQLVFPAFIPGPSSEYGADVTSENTAANTTSVGTIAATDVSSTINGGGGGVATNKVATASVQPNAITTPASAYTAAATIVPNATPTNVQTMTISTTGAVVDLTASFVAYDVVGSSSFYTLEVRRDSTSIYTATIYCTSLPTPVTIALSDAPAAGSYTYTIRVTVSGDPVSFANRLLKTLETKR